MKHLTLLAPLALVFTACQPFAMNDASDAELAPVRLEGSDKSPTPISDPGEAALSFALGHRDLVGGLSARDTFALRSVDQGSDGLYHVRMNQMHDGARVWGAELVVHMSDEAILFSNGNVARGLDAVETAPTLDAQEALAKAEAHYAAQANAGANLEYLREQTELTVLVTQAGNARLAWHTSFFTELQAGVAPGLWNYFVDAQTGLFLYMFNSIDTAAQASGPGGNAKVSRQWTNALDVETSGSAYVMTTSRLSTTNMNHSESGTGTAVTGSLTNIGDAALNDAHGFAEITLNMLQDWFGQNSINNQGFQIKSRVHYGTNYENAFWDGTQMTYGDGATTFYPLSGDVSVVAHEINHGFTSFHSDLVYDGMSGGMNESFSDIAGIAAQFYFKGDTATWDVGRDIFKGDSALRNMCTPTSDGSSIDNADNYTSGIDVHYSSGVMNKAFCLSAKRLGSGSPTGTANAASVKRAATAWFTANQSYWAASSTFVQGCEGVMDAAAALGFSDTEKAAIRDSWLDVGVACDGAVKTLKCDETLTTDSGTLTSPNFPATYTNNYSHTWCIKPASGLAATLSFITVDTESGYDFITIQDASSAELAKVSGTTLPATQSGDLLAVTLKTDSSVVKTGFKATWSTGSVVVVNQPPTVSFTSPAPAAQVSGQVAVALTANDSDGNVAKVTLTLPDGTQVTLTTAPFTYSWSTTALANGAATLTAIATDDKGLTSNVASLAVTIANTVACVNGSFAATGLPVAVPDNTSTGVASTLAVTGPGTVQSLALSLQIAHTYIGDLKVTLTSPAGTQYVVHNRTGGSADNLAISNQAITAFAGQTAAGTWTLNVADLAKVDTGSITAWSLTIIGSCTGTGGGDTNTSWSAAATPNLALVDNGQACTSVTVGQVGNATDVKLDLSGNHTWRSALRATLAHNGTTIAAFPVSTFPSSQGTFSTTSRAISGFSGDASGAWTLCIVDTDAYGDTGSLASWSVHN